MAAIPFTFFASLLQAIASVKPKKVGSKTDTRKPPAALQTLKRWIEEVHKRYSPLPPSTTEVFFRLLFPEEDVSRKYGIQEAKLAQYLAKILAVSTERDGRGRALVDWKAENSVGCLGAEVRNLMEQTYMIPKCIKGQSCSHALNYLKNSEKVWAETKYDGERTQIHVEVRPDGTSKITIFSKSGRNSTWDRFAIHSYVPPSGTMEEPMLKPRN
ncbi:hypothetical protein PHLCEN_2v10391 [Hermanssonia centrifuga]|uniref:DNA ligase ATP-dependent N-terminal domain-containing protein n=1 Tax=Hermanssonia centrifuga TaxID=98765 RepID=A0A2R6NN73_9APHY|nr:hypothetical protein PHLCEN_2v10391 [Hermanssonia centrifuga]